MIRFLVWVCSQTVLPAGTGGLFEIVIGTFGDHAATPFLADEDPGNGPEIHPVGFGVGILLLPPGIQGIEHRHLIPQGPEAEDRILVIVPGGFETEKNLLRPGVRYRLYHLLPEKLDAVERRRKLKRRDHHLPEEGNHTGQMMILRDIDWHIQQLVQAIRGQDLAEMMMVHFIDACLGGHVPLHRNECWT